MVKEELHKIIQNLTLEEKAKFLTGEDYWHTVPLNKKGIPSIMVSDGPSGLRKQGKEADNLGISGSSKAVCYPPASLFSCSFDKNLVYELGTHLAQDAIDQDVNVLLAPAINIIRSPLCGRGFEYFSEDPILTGILASEYVKGVQSKGVGTCLKHYAVNSQEKLRLVSDSIVDERTLHEIYLKAFKMVVEKANPTSIMTAYNKINGSYVAESDYFINKFMRERLNYKGAFITDWGALSNIPKSYKTGLNLEMPGGDLRTYTRIIKAIENGELTKEDLDKRVYELLQFIFKVENNNTPKNIDFKDSLAFSQKVVEESVVLLKNDNKILPLDLEENILLCGEFAQNPRCQGGGSCKVNMIEKDNLVEAFNLINSKFKFVQGFSCEENKNEKYLKEAVEEAKKFDKVVIVVGFDESVESEGYDKTSIDLPECQNVLIEELSKVNNNIIVVVNTGSPITMPWKDRVKGIIYENFCGGQGGKGLSNILYGKVNPSGKLSQTFPIKLEDTPCFDTFGTENRNVIYKEGLFVGYRYYDTASKEVLFPFGHGLSYTIFKILYESYENNVLKVWVKNVGNKKGKEVVQVYKSKRDSKIFRPKKELIAFSKVELEPNEEKLIEITLTYEMFEVYNTKTSNYEIEDGTYSLSVGNSSENIQFETEIYVKGNISDFESFEGSKYYKVDSNKFSLCEFERIYGKKVEPYVFKRPYTIDNTISELNNSFMGKIMVNLMKKHKDAQGDMVKRMINDLPLRFMLMSDYNRDFLDGVLLCANGHIFKGLKLIKQNNPKK